MRQKKRGTHESFAMVEHGQNMDFGLVILGEGGKHILGRTDSINRTAHFGDNSA